ncbi:uncharacterized protein K452DRAFT_239611 [Aplosporella prunicola CBS 121167]|uniref:N-acetyltransferase domain-containing protein n=1 Tax=Aplosporella prunicola CBS 121167 TaxID=1176127 RepID=A0A6A6AVQ8_9PEZI|nr:uncharacterized protein K452DRAFT_239611 [Aplosporella prunicola CBS 121167]KAF2135308.1 hypothetical protein K452DRAFT_239611 [Aplosporella prunicola CBS 121167]
MTWLKKPPAVTQQPQPEPKESKEENTPPVAANPSPPAPKDSLPKLTPLKPLAPHISIEPLTATTIPSFRRLNSLLLEIPYPQKFYDEILTDSVTSALTLGAFWHPTEANGSESSNGVGGKTVLVAGIRCRLLEQSALPMPAGAGASTTTSGPSKPLLYIATLSTLSPYRGHGLATHLLQRVTRTAARDYDVGAVCAHVWVRNEEGLAWYRRRGFEVVGTDEEYYRRLRPQGAWLVKKRVGVWDVLEG